MAEGIPWYVNTDRPTKYIINPLGVNYFKEDDVTEKGDSFKYTQVVLNNSTYFWVKMTVSEFSQLLNIEVKI